jgi:hypothetical protein
MKLFGASDRSMLEARSVFDVLAPGLDQVPKMGWRIQAFQGSTTSSNTCNALIILF